MCIRDSMSVTIADLVKLPSLRDACVVAGAKGMNKAVASISVLEYANAQALKAVSYTHLMGRLPTCYSPVRH